MPKASQALMTERSMYAGISLSEILYGLQLCLCFQSVYYLRKTPLTPRKKQFYICYSILLAVLNAALVGGSALFGQFMWIEKRDLPGGFVEFWVTYLHWWVNTLANAAGVTTNVLGDALLLHRCYIIMHSTWLVIGPIALFVSSTALGITAVVLDSITGVQDGPQVVYNRRFFVAWIALSVTFNVLVTSMISFRILRARFRMQRYANENEKDAFGGVVAILVESALPLSVAGLVNLALVVESHPALSASHLIWGVMTGIAPQLIILRVAQGSAWSKSTVARDSIFSSIQFRHEPNQEVTVMGIPVAENSEKKEVIVRASRSDDELDSPDVAFATA